PQTIRFWRDSHCTFESTALSTTYTRSFPVSTDTITVCYLSSSVCREGDERANYSEKFLHSLNLVYHGRDYNWDERPHIYDTEEIAVIPLRRNDKLRLFIRH